MTAQRQKVSKEDKEKCRLLTPEFRASYPHLFKPSSIDGKKFKFSVTALFPKNTDLSKLQAAMNHAKVAAFGPDKSKWPKIESPVNNGDSPKFSENEGYAGHWAIKFSTTEENRPSVVDENVQPIIDPAKFYPGCYARASVYAYVWEFGGKFGVGFILDHVQKLRDGKSFGGKKPADQVFGPVSGGAGESSDGDFGGEEETQEQDFM